MKLILVKIEINIIEIMMNNVIFIVSFSLVVIGNDIMMYCWILSSVVRSCVNVV